MLVPAKVTCWVSDSVWRDVGASPCPRRRLVARAVRRKCGLLGEFICGLWGHWHHWIRTHSPSGDWAWLLSLYPIGSRHHPVKPLIVQRWWAKFCVVGGYSTGCGGNTCDTDGLTRVRGNCVGLRSQAQLLEERKMPDALRLDALERPFIAGWKWCPPPLPLTCSPAGKNRRGRHRKLPFYLRTVSAADQVLVTSLSGALKWTTEV